MRLGRADEAGQAPLAAIDPGPDIAGFDHLCAMSGALDGGGTMRRALVVCCLFWVTGCEPASRVSAKEVAALGKLAEVACKCERSSPTDISCWNAFNAKVSVFRESVGSATACAPVSTQLRCFNEDHPDGGFCIPTGYALVSGGGSPRQLCSQHEAQVVEATHSAALKRTGDDYEQAAEAAQSAADALIRGEQVSLLDADTGCTG